MKGKFQANKKKSRKSGKKSHSNLFLWILILLMLAVSIGVFAFVFGGEDSGEDEMDDSAISTSESSGESSSESPKNELPFVEPTDGQDLFDLGSGVSIVGFRDYTGAYMEDFSDDVVTDVLGLLITNQGSECVQYMEVVLTAGETSAEFVVSTLLPGATLLVLEKNRMAYSTAPEFTTATTQNVAFFTESPSLMEDTLKIQCLDGVLNVTNISGEDIENDVVIYYKNLVNGVYYGGITYRTRVEGTLAAGEVRQGVASHFSPDNSSVIFVGLE